MGLGFRLRFKDSGFKVQGLRVYGMWLKVLSFRGSGFRSEALNPNT